jgi:murein DD-endopeptidase MepM/ murein hydrolase activator NlpD
MISERIGTVNHEVGAGGFGTLSAFCAVMILILSGCAGLFVKQFGYVAPDAEKIRVDGSTVYIPENAPSISQGYDPAPAEDLHNVNTSAHEGIDIVGQRGTPVIADAAGVVMHSYYEPLRGNRVVIGHGRNENGLFTRSELNHLNERLVNKGDNVVRGQQVGTLGSTGLIASFPHLHYEVRVGAREDQFYFKPINPHMFWMDGAGVVTCFSSSRKWPDIPFRTTYPVPCRGVDWQ